MTAPDDSDTRAAAYAAVSRVVRDAWPRVIGSLVSLTRDLSLAEDALGDAVARALETWPRDGVPDEPRAWLLVTARRRAIDLIRRESRRDDKESESCRMASTDLLQPGGSAIDDDLLRLVFTCCHPALSIEAQVALSLRTLLGLTTEEVAHALLVPEATMAKRLVRARAKIRDAHIPYRVPDDHDLPARVGSVAATVLLVFNEGYAATGGPTALRTDLCDEAIRLGRLLIELMPDDATLHGLLALLLFQDSRRSTRVDDFGDLVLLADQDRSRWDGLRIAEGMERLGIGLRRTPTDPDRYVVLAAIAAAHCLAPNYDETPWDAVVSWYDVLVLLDPSPVVALNRAVAVAERNGAAAGLDELDLVSGLAGYALFHATRAELLVRDGRPDEARVAYDLAMSLDLNDSQRRHLVRRRDTLAT